MDKNRLLSPRQIEGLIADGHTIVIFEEHVLRLDSWLEKHPGGRLAIQHMVGRDATDEMNMYHFPKTLLQMRAFRIGRALKPWTNLIPPLQGGVYRKYPSDSLPTDDKADLDSDESDWSADTAVCWSSSTSISSTPEKGGTTKYLRNPGETLAGKTAPVSKECAHVKELDDSLAWTNLSRAAYNQKLVNNEISEGIQAYPSLDLETQQNIALQYRALHERVKNEGFYTCRYSEYAKDSVRWFILFGGFLYLLNAKWYLTSAAFLGMFWQQIMFTAHDAGHRGITGNFVKDSLIGCFVADFCCGLSIGWWKSSHNVHHLVTNMPEHDPDLQNIPLFATSPCYLKSFKSSFYDFQFVWDAAADFLVQYQKWTYYPIMGLARFNLYFLSWLHLMSPRSKNLGSAWWTRPVEIAMMACYWAWFGYGLVWLTLPTWPIRIGFVLISHTFTMLLHVQITLSHWGMPTSDLGPGESFPQRQLRTTMDVDCPAWLDWLHGGLQFQAVHHLFPRVPRHNLRALQVLVREFCESTHIEYKCYGFVQGNKIILSRLEEVAKMAEALVQCQLHMAETGTSGLH